MSAKKMQHRLLLLHCRSFCEGPDLNTVQKRFCIMAKKEFQAESKKLMDMMINSIYTNKEIFLRELISNASDAIDKLYYKSLTDPSVGMNKGDFRILITRDRENRILTIEDNGIGMSEEFQQHLFEPFAQEADDARTQYQGTGLGLSIVEKLVSAMHGTITFNSQKGVGTSFRVVLPFGIDRTAPTAPVPLPTADFTGIHILLAEDNDLNMEIAEFLLQEHGATVSRAWNGREALTLFDASAPGSFDLILMDIMMPVMDGLEAARAIRALPRPDAQTIPILAMSANAFSDDIRQSLAAGMNDHLSKPIDERKLLAAMARLLGKDEKAVR